MIGALVESVDFQRIGLLSELKVDVSHLPTAGEQ